MRFIRNTVLALAFAATSLVHLGSAEAASDVPCTDNPAAGGQPASHTCYSHVDSLYLRSDYLYLAMTDTAADVHFCTAASGTYFRVSTTNPMLDHYMSLLLAARMSQRGVVVHVEAGSDGICDLKYVLLK